jgi:hypothetical protein
MWSVWVWCQGPMACRRYGLATGHRARFVREDLLWLAHLECLRIMLFSVI